MLSATEPQDEKKSSTDEAHRGLARISLNRCAVGPSFKHHINKMDIREMINLLTSEKLTSQNPFAQDWILGADFSELSVRPFQSHRANCKPRYGTLLFGTRYES